MHSVPNSLLGASLGEAHKWVRSQMVLSNPGKPMSDYALKNENGRSINLSDLTKGNATHVTIVSAGGVRSNPAHPAEISGFMEVPKPMHASRLTALTQSQLTPALYHSMVNEYGLFNAIQTLSILLTRPVRPSLHHTQKTANLIRARKGESLLPMHQFIPDKPSQKKEKKHDNKKGKRGNTRRNPTSGQVRTAAQSLGLGNIVPMAARSMGRAGALGLTLDRTTDDIRREVDRMLDDTEDEFATNEHGALLSVANRMSQKYENNRDIFENFSKQVLAPYLITSTANVNALKYINEYLLPAMKAIIRDGGANKDKKLRKLDRQYRHIVDKLATDPRDFYMGSEFALVAHPAFLFPRAGLALMPVPNSTRDKAFKVFSQAGTPPTYDENSGFVATIDPSDQAGVAYIGRETIQRLGRQTFASNRITRGVARVIDNLVDVIERYGETDSTGFNILVQDTRSMAAMAGNQLYQRIRDMPMFFFVDLPGIRPIPTNWPQNLILAMMEVLAQNRDRITGLGGGEFSATEFLTPSGINLEARAAFGNDNDFPTFAAWQAELTALQALPAVDLAAGGANNERALKALEALRNASRETNLRFPQDIGGNQIGPIPGINIAGYPNIAALQAAFLAGGGATPLQLSMLRYPAAGPIGVAGALGAHYYLHDYLDLVIDANLADGANGPMRGAGPGQNYTIAVSDLINNFDPAYLGAIAPQLISSRPITAQETSTSPSVYQIMLDAVELSMRKYNYNPSRDDIYFTVILLYYSLRNMGMDAEVTGFLERSGEIIERARRSTLDRFINRLNVQFPAPPPGPALIDPRQLNNYLALRFAFEAFNDPTSDAFRALTGVRVNPAPVTDTNIESMKASVKASLDAYESALARTGKDSNSEAIVDSLRKLVMPQLLKQMNQAPQALFTYVGSEETPVEKLVETVDELYKQCDDAVANHIKNLSALAESLNGFSVDILLALSDVKASSEQLDLLDGMATAMDDFMKFLPKSVTKTEKAYVSTMKRFMTLIGDDLQFTPEAVESLIKEIKQNSDDINTGMKKPYPTLATVIRELKEMQEVVAAFDASVEPFEEYSAASIDAMERYPNYPKYDPTDKANPYTYRKREIVGAYNELLVTVENMVSGFANEAILQAKVGLKDDIPIDIPGRSYLDPNPFSVFLTDSPHTSTDYAALSLSSGLKFGRKKRKSFRNMFETKPFVGHEILDIYAQVADEVGVDSLAVYQGAMDNRLESIVDGLYKVYEKKAKRKEGTKRLALGMRAAGRATKEGTMKFVTETLPTTAAKVPGAVAGAAAGAALITKEAFMSVYGPSGAIAEAIKYNWRIAREGWSNKLLEARIQYQRERIALAQDLERAKRGKFVILKLLPAKSKALFKQALYAVGRGVKKAGEQVPSDLIQKVDETAYAIATSIALIEHASRATFDRRAMKKAIESQNEFAVLTQDLLDTLLTTINMQGSTRDNPIVNIALEMVDALKTMQFEAKMASLAMQQMADKLDQEQQVRAQLTDMELETVKTQKEKLKVALNESRDNYQVLLAELQKIIDENKKLKDAVSGYIPAESEDAPVPPAEESE
ncbi:MAG: hypothetical protein CMB45_03170 [Euryarchaeota archaeon]|nr:hypothetical protein [Euryarchaeota archaeon]